MQASEKKVLSLLALLSEQSGEKVSPARLEFLAETLCEISPDKAVVALKKLLESARRFPTVAEVKAEMGMAEPTARDIGNEIAGLIVNTMARVGIPVGPSGVRIRDDMLGPAALFVVDKLGGWPAVVEQAGQNLTALKAQVRDLAESYVKTGHIHAKDIPSSLPSYGQALLPETKQAISLIETTKPDLKEDEIPW